MIDNKKLNIQNITKNKHITSIWTNKSNYDIIVYLQLNGKQLNRTTKLLCHFFNRF